ncbi:MAG: histidine triad nucleotide-binding protein [Parcubacteria group bacterium CG11_big_fil_rev_8_21_14_0_20_39_14]|nr:MAG: histidine triad nucleotide-binding protein [Parcubacteria group bacterium CG11_big_fil_rev_8_21_14_0_20_39_14]PIS35470.1 MAG: histidine triad nucleotide-binding protein [Parcubacteria group bacterium CG08_land_8_20_14_0_20_38_56]
MEQCVFCKIVNKEIPSEIIYENDKICVFKDINPKAPVHILIVPKKHTESLNELDEREKDLLGEMVLAAKKTAKDFGISDGYKLLFNVGKKGGQIVEHLHLHLLGGW